MDQNKDQPIQAAQGNALGRLPAKNAQLMAKDQNLSLESSSRLEASRYPSEEQGEKVQHRLDAY